MPNPVAAIVASSAGSAIVGSRAASKAASAQTTASQEAQATQERMLERQLAETQPFRDLSLQQLNRLAELYGPEGLYTKTPTMQDLLIDPSYSFRLSEGEKALARMQAARGRYLSGGAIRAGTQFGQQLASEEFQNAYNRLMNQRATVTNALMGLGGIGPEMAQRNVEAMGGAGSNISNLQVGTGQARASGYLGQANALSNALSQAAMGYGLSQGGYFGGGGARGGYFGPSSVTPGGTNNLQAFNYLGPRYGGYG